jgi:hypothetical protein
VDSIRVSHLGEYRLPRILLDDSHYFCPLVPELFSLVPDMSMSSAEAIARESAGLGATLRTTAEGIQTCSQARAGASEYRAAVPRVAEHEEEEEAEETGLSLQNLFRQSLRDQVSIGKDADITSGSAAATGLVTQQRVNRMVLCAKAIMATPQVVIGLV